MVLKSSIFENRPDAHTDHVPAAKVSLVKYVTMVVLDDVETEALDTILYVRFEDPGGPRGPGIFLPSLYPQFIQ